MITLKSLTLSGIGRFVDEQTIDFSQLGSLVQVDGQNNNTGGSSGSGKSTIFKALEFLLGLNDISNGVLQSRLTKESMSVTGLFDLDGLPLRIERGKKLLIDLNGEVTTGSSKLTEEKLDQIIGMPRDLFRKILHKRQGEGGFFLDMGPSDVHKFLTSCLGLDKEQLKIVILDTRITSLTLQETSFRSAIESNKMGLEATKSAISSLGHPPALDVDPEATEALKTKYLGLLDTLKLVMNGHKTEMEDLEKSRPQVVTVSFDRSRIVQLENEVGTILAQIIDLEKIEQNRQSEVKSKISELQIKINNLNNVEQMRQTEAKSKLNSNKLEMTKTQYLVNEGNKAKEEVASLVKELQKIKASICPTCEQGWVTESAKAKEAATLQKLQECKKLVVSSIEANKRLLALEEERKVLDLEKLPRSIAEVESLSLLNSKLTLESSAQAIPEVIELKLKMDFKNKELVPIRQEEQDHQFNESVKIRDVLGLFEQKQTELRKTHENILKSIESEGHKVLREYEAANSKIKSFEETKKRFDESLNKLNSQEDKYKVEIETKNTDLISVSQEIELANESKKVIKSYLSCSFEDALDSIGDMATRLIRAIPNMSTATIQFEGLKETKEGKVKEEVTCLISMDGEIGIPVKSLSGGERSSTDLAIDLSVIKFIEERTGKGINLMVLDEPFTGLDTTNVFEALEMLKECSVDKQLLIVDHNPVASQSIESRVTVVRDGLTSKIVQG